ncbi:hypothetical protein KY317_03685 [Candidatus Woesearchaeota archaeon]|nr:hypothetical protein [Candidatus Woesearchaeota archaeon]
MKSKLVKKGHTTKRDHISFIIFWVILGCVLATIMISSVAYAANAYYLIWILVPLYAILAWFGIKAIQVEMRKRE